MKSLRKHFMIMSYSSGCNGSIAEAHSFPPFLASFSLTVMLRIQSTGRAFQTTCISPRYWDILVQRAPCTSWPVRLEQCVLQLVEDDTCSLFQVCTYAQVALQKMWLTCQRRNLRDVISDHALIKPCVDFLETNNEGLRLKTRLLADFFLP